MVLISAILIIVLGAEVRIVSKILSRNPNDFQKTLHKIPINLYAGCNIYSNYWSPSNVFVYKVVNGFNNISSDNFRDGFLLRSTTDDLYIGKEKDFNVENKDMLTVIADYKGWLVVKKKAKEDFPEHSF